MARLHAARDRARQRRAAARTAVEQLRERNREESRRLAERGRPGRRQQWPGHHGPQGQPRELHLYDAEDQDAPPGGPPPQPDVPRRFSDASEDDWSRETWLH